MKNLNINTWTKNLLGAGAITGLLMFTACGTDSNENRDMDTDQRMETGMSDADGVGTQGTFNTDSTVMERTSNGDLMENDQMMENEERLDGEGTMLDREMMEETDSASAPYKY